MNFKEREQFTNICRRIVEEKDRGKLFEHFEELQRFFDAVPVGELTTGRSIWPSRKNSYRSNAGVPPQ